MISQFLQGVYNVKEANIFKIKIKLKYFKVRFFILGFLETFTRVFF